MVSVRTFAVAVVTLGTAFATVDRDHAGEHVEPAEVTAMVPRDSYCAELPTLCTGEAWLYGYATKLTYVCTDPAAPTTLHVTVTKTTTMTPTVTPVITVPFGASAYVSIKSSEEPTTTIRTTTTRTTTVAVVSHANTTQLPNISITETFSVTIPAELLLSTSIEIEGAPGATTTQSRFTVQTTTPIRPTPTGYLTMSLGIVNGTTSGVFYTHPMVNSSAVMPNSSMMLTGTSAAHATGVYPNSTKQATYATPTLKNVETVESVEHNDAAGSSEAGSGVMLGLVGGLIMAILLL